MNIRPEPDKWLAVKLLLLVAIPLMLVGAALYAYASGLVIR